MFRPALAVGVLVMAAGTGAPSAQPDEMTMILGSLADRTRQYYERFISIICTETVHYQDLRFNLSPTGKPRVTVYELSVSRHPQSPKESDFRVERTLQTVNGRPAQKHQQPGCTDPKTGTPEPLGFLLAANQKQFRFTLAGAAAGGPLGTRALDFVQITPEQVRVTWTSNCFEANGGGQEGRVWFDPATFDVLQVDVRLAEPFLVPMAAGSFGLQPVVRVERSEATLRFARVNFTQPDETVLLPESIDTLHALRGVASQRISQKLSNFRRFLSESSIRPSAF